MVEDYRETCQLVAFCDVNQTRMDYSNSLLEDKYDHPKINTYLASEFDKMIEIEKPDIVIVTTVDRTHHTYIVRALELGCDVITEKPMTVDALAEGGAVVLEAEGEELRLSY